MIAKEPLVAILPADHSLASREDPRSARDLIGETFIGISKIPRVLRGVVNGVSEAPGASRSCPILEIDNFAMAISLVTSERGVALLADNWSRTTLPPSVVSRRLSGEQPTVDLVIGYHKANVSPILKRFVSRIDNLEQAGIAQGHWVTLLRALARKRSGGLRPTNRGVVIASDSEATQTKPPMQTPLGCFSSLAMTAGRRYCPIPGSVPIPLQRIVSITSSAPPPIEARRLSRNARLTGVSFM